MFKIDKKNNATRVRVGGFSKVSVRSSVSAAPKLRLEYLSITTDVRVFVFDLLFTNLRALKHKDSKIYRHVL